MLLFHQANVGEGEVASFTFALALPLAVHVNLGHFNHVAHLTNDTQTTTIHQYGDGEESFKPSDGRHCTVTLADDDHIFLPKRFTPPFTCANLSKPILMMTDVLICSYG